MLLGCGDLYRTAWAPSGSPLKSTAIPPSKASRDPATKQQAMGCAAELLSPLETLAHSVSTIAPTTTPVATIFLVCTLAGNGTSLTYVLATGAILLVADSDGIVPHLRRLGSLYDDHPILTNGATLYRTYGAGARNSDV